MSYSGSLIDNVRNLGNNGQLGYSGTWYDGNRQASGWTTPSGSRRLDLVGFTYHHSLAPLLPKSVFRKEIDIFKQAWWKAWNKQSDLSDHSKGFFPTEMAFSPTVIDVLSDEGYEWVIVASHHLSRTCPTYTNYANPLGTFAIKSSPPNRADMLGPSPTSGWWFNEPNPGQASWNVSPHAYQLHRVKYVNPSNGTEKTIIAVPSDDTLSYVAGYSGAQVGMINDNISPYATDSSRPVIVMPSTDGDNAWGGGYSSWMESTPAFFSACQSAGYQVSTVQDMVNAKPPPAGVYTHVEDGAWIFPESDYGSPYFLKWIEPPVGTNLATCYPNTAIDLETPGFALKFWSWSPVISGANWCETAEQMLIDAGGSVASWKVQGVYDFDGSYLTPNVVERAWHIYLCGLDSGFNYYGGLGNDDEVKQSLATRRAIELLQSYVSTNRMNDRTAPTVLRPQRFPWNPGGYTFGWFNRIATNTAYLKKMPSDFYLWTHVYDLSTVATVNVKIRLDNDGTNTMANNQNETYAGGSDVGSWISIAMTKRVLPNTQASLNAAANNGEINYFPEALAPAIADYYFAKITDANVPSFRGKLLDYYVEAVDARGNTNRTDIQHVFVEDDGGQGVQHSSATFSSDPNDCNPLTVTFYSSNGPLQGVSPVYQVITFDAGATATTNPMVNTAPTVWVFTNTVPDNAPSARVHFQNSAASIIDNNSNAYWSAAIRDCDAPTGSSAVSFSNAPACEPVWVTYYPNAGPLLGATQVYAHVGFNNWSPTLYPDPALTKITNNVWRLSVTPPYNCSQLDIVFNNGGGTWDNNTNQDWHFTLNVCQEPTIPDGITITNPSADEVSVGEAVTNYSVQGTAGDNVTGTISWTNALTGAAGSLSKASAWQVTDVALVAGTNVITVGGTLPSGAVTTAVDTAGNVAYEPNWDSGDNGGSGWGGGWILSATANAGHFRAASSNQANLDIGTFAWGLWANNSGLSEAVRPFASPLGASDVFSMKFDNNWIENGGVVGFGLQNQGGTNLFEFYFVGGENYYKINDNTNSRVTDVAYTSLGLDLSFRVVGSSHYVLQAGATTIGGQLAASSDMNLRRLRVFNYTAGPDTDRNLYVDRIAIVQTNTSGGMTTDTVRIVRPGTPYHEGIPVSWWDRYGLLLTNHAAADNDSDGASNLDEYIADTDPTRTESVFVNLLTNWSSMAETMTLRVGPPTTNTRRYDIWVSTDLVNQAWAPRHFDRIGDDAGGVVELTVTNVGNTGYYRTGVRLP